MATTRKLTFSLLSYGWKESVNAVASKGWIECSHPCRTQLTAVFTSQDDQLNSVLAVQLKQLDRVLEPATGKQGLCGQWWWKTHTNSLHSNFVHTSSRHFALSKTNLLGTLICTSGDVSLLLLQQQGCSCSDFGGLPVPQRLMPLQVMNESLLRMINMQAL